MDLPIHYLLKKFYEDCRRVLSKDGILVCLVSSWISQPKITQEVHGLYDKIFGKDKVWAYHYEAPSYGVGGYLFSFCSKGNSHPWKGIDEEKVKKLVKEHGLRYYNEDIHKAAFALPTYAKKMLGK